MTHLHLQRQHEQQAARAALQQQVVDAEVRLDVVIASTASLRTQVEHLRSRTAEITTARSAEQARESGQAAEQLAALMADHTKELKASKGLL